MTARKRSDKAGDAPHLTADEVNMIQDAFAHRRRPGSYEPGKWAVSHYNRMPEVLGGAFPDHYPDRVTIRDITLRVIEQAPGVTVDRAQRRRIGEALLDAGVADIEVSAHGWGMAEEELRAEIAHLKSLRPDLQVKMGATQTEAMVDSAAAAGVTLAEFWMPALPAVTPIYWSEAYRVAWEGHDWREIGIPRTLDEEIDRARQLTARIKSHGLQASAGINLLTLVDDDHIERYCKAVVDAGVDQIWLSDGPAGIAPEGWNHIVRLVKKYAPKQRDGSYIRDTFGLAVATSLAAVHAGADIIEASINGISATAGQVDLAQVAVALEVLYGVHTGIDLSKLTSLSRLVEDISGVRISDAHAVTGRGTHNWGGTEIVVQELKVEPLLHWVYEPELVGGQKQWIVNRTSGMWTLQDKLSLLDLTMPRERMRPTWTRIVNEIVVRRRALTDDEIRTIALEEGATQLPETEAR
jgi:isopropylmalate/homocitrate/citramalate synthase